MFASIDAKPYTAFVGCPVPVVKFSAGSAKNARYARECPSIRSRRGRLSAVFFDAVSATPPILPRTTDTPDRPPLVPRSRAARAPAGTCTRLPGFPPGHPAAAHDTIGDRKKRSKGSNHGHKAPDR
ncbi:hypothetical protein GCM10010518_47030 [Kitasatospora cinereorecta]